MFATLTSRLSLGRLHVKTVGARLLSTSSACSGHHHHQLNSKLHSKIHDYLQGTSEDLTEVLQQNKDFAAKKKEEHPEYFQRTAKYQNPKYLYIGCSDARVIPNQLLGFNHDEVFVTRNIGNQVAPGDFNTMAVMEFSLGVLKVPHVIVCGHTQCGAVSAVLSPTTNLGVGPLDHWLRHLRDVERLHYEEINEIEDDEEKHKRLVELNVIEQCFNVMKTPIVQKLRSESFKDPSKTHCLPLVHGVVYDVATGILKKLPLDFLNDIKKCRDIYDVYKVENDEEAEFWLNRKQK